VIISSETLRPVVPIEEPAPSAADAADIASPDVAPEVREIGAEAKILIINDSPDFLEFMREFLTIEGGYDVATIDQSEGVIEQVTSAPPNLIVLDVLFRHGRSGLDVAEELSASADTQHIPVLFCTALSEQNIPVDQRARINERNQRLVFKPFELDELLVHVRELLSVATDNEPRVAGLSG
jgi:DNA-binding response OmpR family regulator